MTSTRRLRTDNAMFTFPPLEMKVNLFDNSLELYIEKLSFTGVVSDNFSLIKLAGG